MSQSQSQSQSLDRLWSLFVNMHQHLLPTSVRIDGTIKKPSNLTELISHMKQYEQSVHIQFKTAIFRCCRSSWLAHLSRQPETFTTAAECMASLEQAIFAEARKDGWKEARAQWLVGIQELVGPPANTTAGSRVVLTPPPLPKIELLCAAVNQFLGSILIEATNKTLPNPSVVDATKDVAQLATLFFDRSAGIFQSSYKQGFGQIRETWLILLKNTAGPVSAVPLASSMLTLDQWILPNLRTAGWLDSVARTTWIHALQGMGGEVWDLVPTPLALPQLFAHLQTLHKALLPGVVSPEGNTIIHGTAPESFDSLTQLVLAYAATISSSYFHPSFRLQIGSWAKVFSDASVGTKWAPLICTALMVLESNILRSAFTDKWKTGGEMQAWRSAQWKGGGHPESLVLKTPELFQRLEKKDTTLTSVSLELSEAISLRVLEMEFYRLLQVSGSVVTNLVNLHFSPSSRLSDSGLQSLVPLLLTSASKLESFGLNVAKSDQLVTAVGSRLTMQLLAQHPTLKTFCLNGTSTAGSKDPELWQLLLKSLNQNPRLTKLQLASWNIDAKSLNELLTVLRSSGRVQLHQLLLHGNDITLDACSDLAVYLNENKALTRLVLNNNKNLGDGGIETLATAMKTNRTLTSLELKGCNISVKAAEVLMMVAMPNRVLAHVDLADNTDLAEPLKDPNHAIYNFLQVFSLQIVPPSMTACSAPVGSYFSGKIVKGKKEGHGTLFSRNGEPIRSGTFVNNLLEGPGFSVVAASGDRMDGFYVGNKLSSDHLTIVTLRIDGETILSEGYVNSSNKFFGCITQMNQTTKTRREGEILEHCTSARYMAEWSSGGELLKCGLWIIKLVPSRQSMLIRSRPVPLTCFRLARFVPAQAVSMKASALLPDGGWFVGPLTNDLHRLPTKDGVFYHADGTVKGDMSSMVEVWTKEAQDDDTVLAEAVASTATAAASTVAGLPTGASASSTVSSPTASTNNARTPTASPEPEPTPGPATYPSVSSSSSSSPPPSAEEEESGPFEEQFASQLSGIVGQIALKRQLREFWDLQQWERRRRKGGVMKTDMHMVFQGPPGTGKTTMAGLIADVLKRMGIVSGPVSCIHANNVIGKYFGHTEKLVDEAVAVAKGGVLFIDEAYCWSKYHGKHFGPSAISQVMDHIDHRSCVFIFAGYTDEMTEFLAVNAGLSRRVPFCYTFEPYSHQELFEILTIKSEQEELVLKATPDEIGGLINTISNDWLAMQNGGFVSNWLSAATAIKAAEAIKLKLPDSEMSTLYVEHFSSALASLHKMGKIELLSDPLPISDSNPALIPSRYHYTPPPPKSTKDEAMELAKRGKEWLQSKDGQSAIMKIGKELFNHFSPIKVP